MATPFRHVFLFCALFLTAIKVRAQEDTLVSDETDITVEETYVDPEEETPDFGFLRAGSVRDSFPERRIPDAEVRKLRESDDFWYANAEVRKQKRQAQPAGGAPTVRQPWFQSLLWIITVGGFAAFIIWYLAGTQIGLFRRKQRTIGQPSAEGELSEGDLFALDYPREINRAVSQGNYRLATRLLFLRSLKELAERNIIEYRQGRTNFDYLMQLQPTAYYDDFFRITRTYEYCWYGKFDVDADKFGRIRQDFERFETRL